MPEPTRESTTDNPLRRALEEGARHLPRNARELPGFAIKTAVIGAGKLVEGGAWARQEYGELRRNGIIPTLDRLRREGLELVRPEVPATPASDTSTASEVTQATPASEQPDAPAPRDATATPAHDELPLPSYDQLTLGSIRARLRNLSIADLGTLLAYERAHQKRSNIITMYENRILKLQKERGA